MAAVVLQVQPYVKKVTVQVLRPVLSKDTIHILRIIKPQQRP
jgi:hypothetical protein